MSFIIKNIKEYLELKNYKMLKQKLYKESKKAINTHLEKYNDFRDIIITLPKTINWSDYELELNAVKDGKEVMNFKVNALPKTTIGKRCYIVHNGYIKGWMKITGMSSKEFKCSTTGKLWKGNFVERSGPFNYIDPIPMKGFQGFRYY